MPQKPPLRRVPSDDFVFVDTDGQHYHTHEGESVDLVPGAPVALFKSYRRFRQLSIQLDALEGEPDEGGQRIELLDPAYDEVVTLLAQRLQGWTWTDIVGEPLPSPHGAPEVLRTLDAQELNYLLQVTLGNAPAERKNGSSALPTRSSATARRRTAGASSTSDHSHTRG